MSSYCTEMGRIAAHYRRQSGFYHGVDVAGAGSPEGVRRQLDRWVRAGKIVMLRRGVYALREPYARREPHPFVVANTLRAPAIPEAYLKYPDLHRGTLSGHLQFS